MSKYLQTNYVDKPIAMTEQRRNENSAEQQTSNFHPIFLSSIIILISFCLFVSAVSLPEWRLEISVGDKNNKVSFLNEFKTLNRVTLQCLCLLMTSC